MTNSVTGEICLTYVSTHLNTVVVARRLVVVIVVFVVVCVVVVSIPVADATKGRGEEIKEVGEATR
jgi:hypothetical protein